VEEAKARISDRHPGGAPGLADDVHEALRHVRDLNIPLHHNVVKRALVLAVVRPRASS
jgi:hypothetical protein